MGMTKASETASGIFDRPFTSGEADALGISYRRLLREDVRRVSRQLYVPGHADVSVAERLRAHLSLSPSAWGSHRSAAAVHGLWLPEAQSDHRLLHVSRREGEQRARRVGVVGHRVRILPGEVVDLGGGLLVSSPARTWLDIANELGPVGLVVMGDQLIRRPRPEFEGRSQPYSTPASLVEMLQAHPHMRGIVKLRAALRDMRIGADSVPESLLRLCLLAYHFPEPELQIRLHPSDPRSPSGDLGYPEIQVVIQYEGAHHQQEEQRLRDARRDTAFRRAGWIIIHVTAEDLRDDFARVRAELRVLFAKRAA